MENGKMEGKGDTHCNYQALPLAVEAAFFGGRIGVELHLWTEMAVSNKPYEKTY